MSKILVIGDLMLDIYYQGSVNRISPEAPVPVLKKKNEEKYVPGGACNVAMNAVAAGSEVSLIGILGKDRHGDMLKKIMSEAGVDISFIRQIDIETISKIRFISNSNQQLLRMDIEDTDRIRKHINYEGIIKEIENVIHEYDIIVLSDYLKGLLNYELTQSIINNAREIGVKVLVDVKDSHIEKYKNAWLIKPNLMELSNLTNMPVGSDEEIIAANKHLLNECNCEYVLTTCGSKGMVLVGRGMTHHLETEGKTVYDVTGAGDTVIAYLAVCLACGDEIKKATEISNYAAGIQVGKVGTSSVYIQEVQAIMNGLGVSYSKKKLRWRDLDDFTEKAKGRSVVFTNGCFDILHVGHKRYLEEAKKLGDILVVGVNSDDSVRRLKGQGRPVNTELDRVEMLTALDCVDYVIVFEDDTPYDLISRIRPKILVKGGDYKPEEIIGKDIVENYGGKIVIIPLVEGKSSTSVIEKIKSS